MSEGQEESFFTKLANEVLDASEKLANRFDEGLAALWDGTASSDGGAGASSSGGSVPRETLTKEQLEASLNGEEFSKEDLRMMQEELAEMPGSPLEGMAESVLGDIMKNQASPQSPMEHFHAFRHAITWKEPFILALIAFQIFMFMAAIYVSRRERGLAPRLAIMISIAALVRGAEAINRWASQNWEQFATQNYFDSRGVFVSVMVCAPLLLDSLIMLLLFLREASGLLVQVKTAQLKKQKKQKQSQNNSSNKKAGDGASNKRSKKTKKED